MLLVFQRRIEYNLVQQFLKRAKLAGHWNGAGNIAMQASDANAKIQEHKLPRLQRFVFLHVMQAASICTARDNRPAGPGNLSGNLAAKKALIEEIKAYVPDDQKDAEARKDFEERWKAIGFVPFKEKDAIQAAFREAMEEKFPGFGQRGRREGGRREGGNGRRPLTESDRLKEQFTQLQQEIQTYENNIGFFGLSKGAEKLKAQMQERIDAAKAKLEDLKAQIRAKEQEGQQ